MPLTSTEVAAEPSSANGTAGARSVWANESCSPLTIIMSPCATVSPGMKVALSEYALEKIVGGLLRDDLEFDRHGDGPVDRVRGEDDRAVACPDRHPVGSIGKSR